MAIDKILLVPSLTEFVVSGFDEHIFMLLSSYDALISGDCCNKLLQVKWFNTTKTYYLTFLEARSPKSGCQQGCTSSGDFREESIPCFFQLLGAAGIPGLVATSLSTQPLPSHCFPLCVSFPSLSQISLLLF